MNEIVISVNIKFPTEDIMMAVQKFCHAALMKPYEIEMTSNRYIINAKSILGVLSIDISKPINTNFYCSKEEFEQIKKEIMKFGISVN